MEEHSAAERELPEQESTAGAADSPEQQVGAPQQSMESDPAGREKSRSASAESPDEGVNPDSSEQQAGSPQQSAESDTAHREQSPPVSAELPDEAVNPDSEVGGDDAAGEERPGTAVPSNLKSILEAALFAAGEPLSLDQLAKLFDEHETPARATLRQTIAELQSEYEGRGVNLVEVASGFRFQVGKQMAPWVSRLWEEKPQRYSRAFLETLALIAYRQPITRAEIEEVRGVSVSSNIIKSLSERGWVRIVGHRDVPGRPAIYATTRQFLDYFGLASLDELPPLSELKDIDRFNEELDLKDPDGEAAGRDGRVPPIPIPAADIEPLIM